MKLNEDYFFCFGCGAKGDVIDFVAKLFDLSSYEAAQKCEIGDLVSWADAFDEADPETRKMIIARLVERIDIGADYSISIRFRISMKQYTGDVA